MAVKLETKIYRYNALSSDSWPTSGVTEGSTLHVIDTGEEYIFHDDAWETDLRRIHAMTMVV